MSTCLNETVHGDSFTHVNAKIGLMVLVDGDRIVGDNILALRGKSEGGREDESSLTGDAPSIEKRNVGLGGTSLTCLDLVVHRTTAHPPPRVANSLVSVVSHPLSRVHLWGMVDRSSA